jgi:hypothetical protein
LSQISLPNVVASPSPSLEKQFTTDFLPSIESQSLSFLLLLKLKDSKRSGYTSNTCATKTTGSKIVGAKTTKSFVSEVINHLHDDVESILYYPHPFTKEGLVIVFKREAGFVPDLISKVYSAAPLNVSQHYLRRDELFELSIPGQFLTIRPGTLNEHPHLAYWLKYAGVVLYGRDVRDELVIPDNPRAVLKIHLERCIFYLRNNCVLHLLMSRKYIALIKELDLHLRHLMATALLIHHEWEVTVDKLPKHFEQWFADDQMKEIWREFSGLLPHNEAIAEGEYRQPAFEAVWLFERFVERLQRYAQ